MTIINQIFLYIAIIAITVFGGAWLFNHVNPWLGIGFPILVVYGALTFIVNQLKKKEVPVEKT